MNKNIIRLSAFGALLFAVALTAGAQDVSFTSDSLSRTTGAVSTVGGSSLYKVPAANLTNTLTGLLNGLAVEQGDGIPGNDLAGLYVRGIGTYGMEGASNTAKVYVDGFETNIAFLKYLIPAEIKSISVLKDAAVLAPFGMNGSEGVIWIETKRGGNDGLKVDFQVRSGLQAPINVSKALGTASYTKLYNLAVSNDDNTGDYYPYYDADYVGPDVDWWNEVMRPFGLYTDTDLAFHGGNGNVNYNVVLGYGNQQGLFKVQNADNTSNSRFERYTVRAALDVRLTKVVTASVDMGGRLEDTYRPNYSIWSLMDNVASYPANIYPVYDEMAASEDLNFSGTAIYPDNPVASIKGLGWLKDHTRIIQSNFKFKEDLDDFVKGLYFQEGVSFYVNSTGRYSKTRNYARFLDGVPQTTDQNTSMTASAFNARQMEEWIQGYAMAGYDNSFGQNRIRANATFRVSSYMGEGRFQYRNHYMNVSGMAEYSWADKYIAALSYSYFGSDAYAKGSRWKFYPALSAAWVASNEDFLKGSETVDFLKLRLSAGLTGYAGSAMTGDISSYGSGGRYLYQQYYSSSQSGTFYTGNSAPFSSQGTLAPLFLANEKVGPETSFKVNLGVDARLLKGLDITFDAFYDKRSGILTLDKSIMNYYGSITKFDNVGRMTNLGAELLVRYGGSAGAFDYSVFGAAAFTRNVIDYMAEAPTAYDYNAKTGRPYGSRIGLKCLGFYDVNDFNDDGTLNENLPVPMFGHVQPGDLKYSDLDKDGHIDQTDVDLIGNPYYPFLNMSLGASLAFKGFDFSILLTGAVGATIDLMDFPEHTKALVNNGNAFPIASYSWAFYPDAGIDTRSYAEYPRLTLTENNNNYRASDFWIKSNNYLRIKTAELGYDLSGLLSSKVFFSKARVYVNAMNPLTLSGVLSQYGMDPESYYGYPALKSFNLGVQLSF